MSLYISLRCMHECCLAPPTLTPRTPLPPSLPLPLPLLRYQPLDWSKPDLAKVIKVGGAAE
jgi:hypothetical protein